MFQILAIALMNYKYINHDSIPPFYDKNSKILILGSFPSVGFRKS